MARRRVPHYSEVRTPVPVRTGEKVEGCAFSNYKIYKRKRKSYFLQLVPLPYAPVKSKVKNKKRGKKINKKIKKMEP